MNKEIFLNQLKIELSDLPQEEVLDIIRDQEELIRDAVMAGRSEEDVVISMGSPNQLAKSLKAESRIDRVAQQSSLPKQFKSLFGAIAAILILAPFNLIFILGPFLFVVAMVLTGWALAISVNLAAVFIMILFLTILIFLPVGLLTHLTTFFAFLGGIGLAALSLFAMYFLTKFFVKTVVGYLKWNLNFVKSQA